MLNATGNEIFICKFQKYLRYIANYTRKSTILSNLIKKFRLKKAKKPCEYPKNTYDIALI